MSKNPYESPGKATQAAKSRSLRLTIGGVLVPLAIGLLLIALLLPASRGSREAARRNACINNLKQIGLALHNYEFAHGVLPPAYTVDAKGNRLHSWRTLILPYAEESQLYETIDLSKPWDDPVNAKARETIMPMYLCPGADHAENLTTYLGMVGPDCAFSGSAARALSEIADGTSRTIGVIEVDADRAVHWMSPRDADEEMFLSYGPESRMHHPGFITALFLDGHVAALPLDSDRDDLRAMLSIAGGEAVTD